MTVPPQPRGSAPITAGGPGSNGRGAPRRRPLPFALHQLLEYILAGVLVEMSLHTGRAGLLLAGAIAFALLALTARGPLGVARVCGGRLHAALDVTVALALAAAPILPALRPGTLGIVAVEVIAVLWLRVVTLTRHTTARPLPPDASSIPPPSDQVRSDQNSGTQVPVPSSTALARTLGLVAGRTARRFPNTPDDLADRARLAGRRFSRAQQAWRARSRP